MSDLSIIKPHTRSWIRNCFGPKQSSISRFPILQSGHLQLGIDQYEPPRAPVLWRDPNNSVPSNNCRVCESINWMMIQCTDRIYVPPLRILLDPPDTNSQRWMPKWTRYNTQRVDRLSMRLNHKYYPSTMGWSFINALLEFSPQTRSPGEVRPPQRPLVTRLRLPLNLYIIYWKFCGI